MRLAAHQDAAAIFWETGDQHGEGRALDNLGNALREVRRFDEGVAAHQEERRSARRPATGTARAWR